MASTMETEWASAFFLPHKSFGGEPGCGGDPCSTPCDAPHFAWAYHRASILTLTSFDLSTLKSNCVLTMSLFGPASRRLFAQAPRLFVCNSCLRATPPRSPASKILNVVRWRSSIQASQSSSPLRALGDQFGTKPPATKLRNTKEEKARGFPNTSSKAVGYWLLGSALSVAGIVVLGGLTRLTESGFATPTLPVLPD